MLWLVDLWWPLETFLLSLKSQTRKHLAQFHLFEEGGRANLTQVCRDFPIWPSFACFAKKVDVETSQEANSVLKTALITSYPLTAGDRHQPPATHDEEECFCSSTNTDLKMREKAAEVKWKTFIFRRTIDENHFKRTEGSLDPWKQSIKKPLQSFLYVKSVFVVIDFCAVLFPNWGHAFLSNQDRVKPDFYSDDMKIDQLCT